MSICLQITPVHVPVGFQFGQIYFFCKTIASGSKERSLDPDLDPTKYYGISLLDVPHQAYINPAGRYLMYQFQAPQSPFTVTVGPFPKVTN